MGYNAYTVEDFHDTFMELVDRLQPSGDEQVGYLCDPVQGDAGGLAAWLG